MRWPYQYEDSRGRDLILCLTRISPEEREATKEVVRESGCARDNPLLMHALQERLPVFLSREELLYLVEDLEKCDERLKRVLTGSARDGYLALTSFVRQAADQRDAEVSFEEKISVQPGDGPASVLVIDGFEKPLGIDVLSVLESVGLPVLEKESFVFEEVWAWNGFFVVGVGHRVHLIPLDGADAWFYDLGSYFGHLYSGKDHLLVASARDLLCLDADGSPRWWARGLGNDGVLVEGVWDDLVHGEGQWDTPGGWVSFAVQLDSGERVS